MADVERFETVAAEIERSDADRLILMLRVAADLKGLPETVESSRRALIRSIVMRLAVLVMLPDYITEGE